MEFDVDLDRHHLEGLAAQPTTAILELIWNALDADAGLVEVSFARNALDGVEEIRVTDDGHGMTHAEAITAFRTLGASWKLRGTRTRSGQRALHGKHGRGRFRAGGIGQVMRWETVAEEEDQRSLVTIEIGSDNLQHGQVSDPQPTDRPVGTKVVIAGISEHPQGLGEGTPDRLLAHLAIYLEQYHPTVIYDRETIDPSAIQLDRTRYELELDDQQPVLDIIEWARSFPRALYLCNPAGMALGDLPPGIQAPGFYFTAYLRWEGFENETRVLTPELDAESGALIDLARDHLRHHFRERSEDELRQQVEQWKTENVYPYGEESLTDTEEVARELFDVVAVTARDAVNAGEAPAKRLSLSLLRQAIEQDPGSLRRVLQEVLDLPEDKLQELDELLSQTTLASVISLSRSITNRLDFLKALEEMILDPELKGKVLERKQLHRILANETWIFGEEYALAADDESLRTALQRHIEILGRQELASEVLAEPVEDPSGRTTAIVDLMLARSVPLSTRRREHLVVELKRPSVDVGAEEAQQIKDYAIAVARDERFEKADVQWDFIVVAGSLAGTVIEDARQHQRPLGLIASYEDDHVRVWAKTWGEIIEDADHRLKFVQEHLGYDPSAQQAFRYLRERHAEFVPPAVAEASAHGIDPVSWTDHAA